MEIGKKFSNLRSSVLLAALALAGLTTAAHAQFGVYGMVQGENIKNITCLDPSGTCAASNGTAKPYGGAFGAYYDFKTYGPIRLGGDIRGTFLNSNKSAYYYQGGGDLVRHYSVLGGVRGTIRTPFHVLRPYVQVSGGLGRTNGPQPSSPGISGRDNYKDYGQVQGFVGLDLALFPNLDFRVIEFGAGEVFGSNSHSIQSIGLGVVFHTSRSSK